MAQVHKKAAKHKAAKPKAALAPMKAASAPTKRAKARPKPARAKTAARKGAGTSAAKSAGKLARKAGVPMRALKAARRTGASALPKLLAARASARRPKPPAARARPEGRASRAGAASPAPGVPGVRTGPLKLPATPGQAELNVGDDALHKATGLTWAQWFKALDAAGARTLPHSDILRLVFQRFRVNPWWSETVTVGYEQARGLREKHEKADGYSISASKTLAAPAERVYAAWNVDAERGRWLGMNLKVRSATPPKSIRLNWSDPLSQIVVMLNPRGAGKTQVAVEHNRLKDRAECARMRTFWASALERLGAAVGGL